jgi:acetyl-CoA C-acetyltransferase
VTKYEFTREAQDKFAISSTERALAANKDGSFAWEMAPVTIKGKAGDTVIDKDEQPFKAKLDKIPGPEAGVQEGRHHHRRQRLVDLRRRGRAGADARVHGRPRVSSRSPASSRIRTHAQAPEWFTTAPVGAIQKVLAKSGWTAATSTCGKSTRPSPRSPWRR